MLNKIRVVNIDDVEKLFKAKFINKSDETCPTDILCMNAENEPAMRRNEAVLNYPLGQLPQ